MISIDLDSKHFNYTKRTGIVLDEPSVVAIQEKTKTVVAVGHDAKKMLVNTNGADHLGMEL